jgi:hypothetical protein
MVFSLILVRIVPICRYVFSGQADLGRFHPVQRHAGSHIMVTPETQTAGVFPPGMGGTLGMWS